MKSTLLMALCGVALMVSGCAAGITRTGYKLPKNQNPNATANCRIAIKNNFKYDTNDVTVLGSIHAYDTGLSTDCDEAAVLDIFVKDGCMLGADVINITDEKQPSPWTSSCYRARATFLRFKDRELAKNVVSDPKYAPQLIIDRSVASGKRTRDVIAGTVMGGLLGYVITSAATEPPGHTNYIKTASPREMQKH